MGKRKAATGTQVTPCARVPPAGRPRGALGPGSAGALSIGSVEQVVGGGRQGVRGGSHASARARPWDKAATCRSQAPRRAFLTSSRDSNTREHPSLRVEMFEAASRPAERHVQAHLGRSGHPPLGAPRANRTSELHLERSGVQSRHAEAHQAGSVRPPKPSQTLLRRWRRAGVAAARAARAGRGGVRGGAAAAARARRPGAGPPQRAPGAAAQRRCFAVQILHDTAFLRTALHSMPALSPASQSPLAWFAIGIICIWY